MARSSVKRKSADAGAPGARKRVLNREVVVRAALEEIDENGLAAFSLRVLAQRLGVYPTAIYWHVPNRNEILSEVVAEAFRPATQLPKTKDWREFIRVLFQTWRACLKRHPNLAPLVGTQLTGNLHTSFDFVEAILEALQQAGLSGASLVAGYNTVIAALVGFVTQEFAPLPETQTGAWQSAVQQRLLGVDPDNHPVLAANLPLLANKAFILRWQNGAEAPLDRSFEVFIDAVVAGVDSLSRGASRAS